MYLWYLLKKCKVCLITLFSNSVLVMPPIYRPFGSQIGF